MLRLPDDFFKKSRVNFIQGSPVCSILPNKNTLILKNGKSIKYDKLLIATGSVPIVPPIEGIDKKGVFFLDTLTSSKKIINYIRKNRTKKAVIVGAGFTGIEAALSLKNRDLKVTIVEMLKRVFARILDKDMSTPFETMLTEKDIELKLGEQVVKITGDKNASGVRLKTGSLVMADIILVSIGVKPNIEIINGSGIKTNRGILVNNHMGTNLENIYAAGDVAEAKDFLTGKTTLSAIWPNAIEQGRIAALNMTNKITEYEGATNVNVLNLEGQSIVSMGKTLAEAKDEYKNNFEEIKYDNNLSRRKIILNNNRVIGFQSIGPFRNHGIIWSNLKNREDISEIKESVLKDNFNLRG